MIKVPEYVTVTEISRRTSLSRVTVLKRLREGSIPGYGTWYGSQRVQREPFEKWMENQDPGKTAKVG